MFVFLLWMNETAKGFIKNFWWNMATLIMSIICLLSFSVFFVAKENLDYLTKKMNDRLEITVNVSDDANIVRLKETINNDSRVENVQFYSKGQVQERVIQEMGDDAKILENFDGRNIFPAQFIVKVKNPEDIESFSSFLTTQQYVDKVFYGEQYLDIILKATDELKRFGFWISIGGFVVVFMLIIVVIRMNIEQRKEEIYIKGLIGSGMFTIRMPFILEAWILALVSSFVSYTLFMEGYDWLIGMFAFHEMLLPIETVKGSLLFNMTGLAMVVALIGSLIATHKHLKKI